MPISIGVGDIRLGLRGVPRPMPRADFAYALSQSWDWPEAEQCAKAHKAHVIFTTQAGPSTPRAEVVALHKRAHAALGEFAQMLAVCWPAAGRLVPPADAERTCSTQTWNSPAVPSINFRTFTLSDDPRGEFLSDTVGLHAFGLPDMEVATASEPDETVSAVLYKLADRFFSEGCAIQERTRLDLQSLGEWRATPAESSFKPHRRVLRLRRIDPDSDAADDAA
jgi:hypothetical protein